MLWRESMLPLRYMRTCVWVKPNGMPQMTGDRPGMGYESIVCCHSDGRSRWNGGGRKGVFDFCSRDSGMGAEPNLHPSQKPLALMLELVSLFSDPGEVVIDPYCGSGTTGAACLRLGRRFVGIEKDAAWAKTARERLEAESRKQSIDQYRKGQTTIFERTKA